MAQVLGPTDSATETEAACATCSAIVAEGGVGRALAWLNARTRYRFTGIYRVEPPLLRNVVLFDRENPDVNVSGEVSPLDETYCALTFASGPLSITDASSDARLAQHAARASVISYDGVPMRLANGQVWGTLCHYDVRPRLLKPDERLVLEAVVPVLIASLHSPSTAAAISALPARSPRDSAER